MNIKRIITASIISPVAMTAAIAGISLGWDGEAKATANCGGYEVKVKNVYSPETVTIIHTPASTGTWNDPYTLETVKGNTEFSWTDYAGKDDVNPWVAVEPAECLKTAPTTTVTPPAPQPTVPTITGPATVATPVPAAPKVTSPTPALEPAPVITAPLVAVELPPVVTVTPVQSLPATGVKLDQAFIALVAVIAGMTFRVVGRLPRKVKHG